jgi:hypothetical protein
MPCQGGDGASVLSRIPGLLVNTAHFKNNSQKIIGTASQAGQELRDHSVTSPDI